MLGHPRDIYHRVDAIASSRHVQVTLGGETLAESTRPMAVFETGAPTRFYLAQADVRLDLLEPSETTTTSPYMGSAVWFGARIDGELHPDVAWTYRFPIPQLPRIAGLLAFRDELVRSSRATDDPLDRPAVTAQCIKPIELDNRLVRYQWRPTPSASPSRLSPTPRAGRSWRVSRTGAATVKELSAPFAMSGPAVSKHLRVLERAGLIVRGREAQWRPCRLEAAPLEEVAEWAEHYRRFWDASYERLDEYLRHLKQKELDDDDGQ